ncbi:MAG: HK97 family phage prohead protease [Aeromonas veronii]
MKNQDFQFKIKNFEATDEDQGIFTAYANVKWFRDYVGDVTIDNAFTNSIRKATETGRMPKMLFNHDSDKVIGVWLSMEEDEHGLKVVGQLAMKTQRGREIFELLKIGALDALSIGYRTVKEQYDPATNTNFLIEVDIREVSVVVFPCNDQSLVSSVKSEEEIEVATPEVEPEIKSEEIKPDVEADEEEKIEVCEDINKPDEEEIINQKLDDFLLSLKLDRFLAAYRK